MVPYECQIGASLVVGSAPARQCCWNRTALLRQYWQPASPIPVLHRYYSGTALVQSWSCIGAVGLLYCYSTYTARTGSTLARYCYSTHDALVMHWRYGGNAFALELRVCFVLVSYREYTGRTPYAGIQWYFNCTSLVLYWYCTRAALVLRWHNANDTLMLCYTGTSTALQIGSDAIRRYLDCLVMRRAAALFWGRDGR